MALDPVKNFAITRVATAPTPANSGTTLVVDTGDGSLFPAPATSGEFNLVIYPNGEQPSHSNAEIVRVTARTADTMTIVRSQEGTNARTIVAGDIAMLGITAKVVSDLSTAVTGVVTETGTQTLTNKTLTAPALTSPTVSGTWDGWISAGETWTYASADDPTYTFTVAADVTTKYSVGMKIKLTQGTVKYFIITAISAFTGGNTTITVYGGTDYDLADSAITNPYYSMVKAPQGFPLDPDKWSEEFSTTTRGITNPASQDVWCNPGSFSLSIPIGSWDVFYKVVAVAVGGVSVRTSLSTANNSESDSEFTTRFSGVNPVIAPMYVGKAVTLTSKTTYYLVAMSKDPSISQIRFHSDDGATVIRATCAYL